MKKIYDFLKYIIYSSLCVIILKAGFDFFNYKKYPDIYAYNSAPWYTGALTWSVFLLAVVIVCVILRKIIFSKMIINAKNVVTKEINTL